jgi:adenylate kinase
MAESNKRIVLLGKPGSGKGTQAALLAEALDLPHLSSGEVLRAEIREGTDFGRAVEEYVMKGEIGPEELITKAILGFLERSPGRGYILDGFPRTIFQAEALTEASPPDSAILLSVPDEVIIERISKRLTCTACGAVAGPLQAFDSLESRCEVCGGKLARRPDDHPDAIAVRLETFREQVGPVIEYYRNSGLLIEIDGTGRVEEIQTEMFRALEKSD